jgi:hypothetical protein
MPAPRKSQKQIAQRYTGNLLYNTFFHPLRRGRVILALWVLLLGMIIAAVYLRFGRTTPQLEWFNSPGQISEAHAGFARDCKQCHEASAGINLLDPSAMTASIDSSCLRCHADHTFHQPDVTVDHSCVACHHEHLGAGPMQPVADVNCRVCHSSAAIMAASAKKGSGLPPEAFAVLPLANLAYFQPPRPAGGYTKVIHSFDGDHPDFQIQRDHLVDPDTLKFDHKIHLTGNIPLVNGKKLDCASCHQPDSRGAYMQPISFAANCQACHALQIDPTLPGFQIPHPRPGDQAGSVRDFILTLPTQYSIYAAQHMQQLHLTEPAQISAFVAEHMKGIRQRAREGDDLIQDTFFADAQSVRWNGTAAGRSLFPGCAYCHQVETSAAGAPEVTRPLLPDRWYVHAKFDHSAHTTVSCESCHSQARQSEKTSDILLPDKASCVTCHSAKGGVVSTCVTCHGYHNPSPSQGAAGGSSLRQLLLAKPSP